MYKENEVLNNQQWLICHRIQPNQINQIKNKIGFLSKSFSSTSGIRRELEKPRADWRKHAGYD